MAGAGAAMRREDTTSGFKQEHVYLSLLDNGISELLGVDLLIGLSPGAHHAEENGLFVTVVLHARLGESRI